MGSKALSKTERRERRQRRLAVCIAVGLAVGEVTLLLWSIHGGVSKLHEEWPGFASEDSNSTAGSECDAIEQIKNGFDLATRRGECDAWRAGDALVLLTRT